MRKKRDWELGIRDWGQNNSKFKIQNWEEKGDRGDKGDKGDKEAEEKN
jgi:hypothetical protein